MLISSMILLEILNTKRKGRKYRPIIFNYCRELYEMSIILQICNNKSAHSFSMIKLSINKCKCLRLFINPPLYLNHTYLFQRLS